MDEIRVEDDRMILACEPKQPAAYVSGWRYALLYKLTAVVAEKFR
jgi:hypothetical protein